MIEQVVRCRESLAESKSHCARYYAVATIPGDGDLASLLFASRLPIVSLGHRHGGAMVKTRARRLGIVPRTHQIARAKSELKHQPAKNETGESANHVFAV